MKPQLKLIACFLAMLCLIDQANAQKIIPLRTQYIADSSFYHIEKISDNEFWVGGENGILKSLDSNGKITNIPFPEARHILMIKAWKGDVIISTDSGCIFKYSKNTKQFSKKQFHHYEHLCFYDFTIESDDNILVCGGHNKIAKAQKVLPKGFIARVDSNLSEIKPIWKSWRKFVWAIEKGEGSVCYASVFNGFNSAILNHPILQAQKWKRLCHVKGLVHDLAVQRDTLFFSGSSTSHIHENGIIGFAANKTVKKQVLDGGCIWNVISHAKRTLAVNQLGVLSNCDKEMNVVTNIEVVPQKTPLYEITPISDTKYYVAGNGSLLYIIDFVNP